MKYQSELINEIIEVRGHKKSSLHYESECVEPWIEETNGAYPKLCEYEGEWLNYMVENPIGSFPYETITANPTATVSNVVPYAYKSAILKGRTGYRDIDTGEILETFEEGRNLELVSVKMPVLTTTGKNLFDGKINRGIPSSDSGWQEYIQSENFIKVNSHDFIVSINNEFITSLEFVRVYCYDENKNYISTKAIVEEKPSNTRYIKISAQTINNPADLTLPYNIQVEQGHIVTAYEPFKSNILTVNEDVELRGIGEVKDTLNLMTGELTQRIGKWVFNGTQSISRIEDLGDYVNIRFTVDGVKYGKEFLPNNIYCDVLPVVNTLEVEYNQECVKLYGQVDYMEIRLTLSKTKVSTNANSVNTYLQSNPITVQYRLATESIKTVELTVTNQNGETLSKIKPIEGTMHVSTSSQTLPPLLDMSVPVEATSQNLNSFIEEE